MLCRRAALAASLLVLSSASAGAVEGEPGEVAYERALDRYAAGDVAGALESMEESLRLSGRMVLLYNVARLEEEAGDCTAALAHYREYLERVPHGQLRKSAEAATSKLSEKCERKEEIGALTVPPPTELEWRSPVAPAASSPSSSASAASPSTVGEGAAAAPSAPRVGRSTSRYSWVGWSALAGGVTAGAGALYFTARAHQSRSRWQVSMSEELKGGAWADWSLLDDQHRSERWAQGLAVAGGVLATAGIVLLVLNAHDDASPASARLTTRVAVAPGYVTATFGGRF